MICTFCNDTLYAKVPNGVAPCNACEPGRRMIAAREAHAMRYRPRKRESKPLTAAGVKRLAKNGKEKAAGS